MLADYNYQPVFLIGAARSGTKLVRDTIACHPEVSKIPYDINYIWRYGNENLPHDEILPDHLTLDNATKIQHYFKGYSQQKPVLIEKTVSNSLRVPFVQAIFPQAKFIHLIRDGWDVVESSYRQWIAPPDWHYIFQKVRSYPFLDAFGYASGYAMTLVGKLLNQHNGTVNSWGPRYAGIDVDIRSKPLIEVCATQWARCVTKAFSDLAKYPRSRVYTLRYEEFVRNPLAELTGIADFLKVDAHPYSSNKALGISANNIGKGQRNLSDEQCLLVHELIEKTETFVSDALNNANNIVSNYPVISTN